MALARSSLVMAAVIALAAGSASAQEGLFHIPEGGPTRDTRSIPMSVTEKSTALSGVTVVMPNCPAVKSGHGSAEPPRIVSTFPARGAVVRPGLLTLRITFNTPMACGGSFFSERAFEDPCPGEGPRGERVVYRSKDRRTFTTLCQLDPGASYAMWVNYPGLLHQFTSLAGQTAAPYDLSFTTSAGPPITDPAEALAEDKERTTGLPGRDAPGLTATRAP